MRPGFNHASSSPLVLLISQLFNANFQQIYDSIFSITGSIIKILSQLAENLRGIWNPLPLTLCSTGMWTAILWLWVFQLASPLQLRLTSLIECPSSLLYNSTLHLCSLLTGSFHSNPTTHSLPDWYHFLLAFPWPVGPGSQGLSQCGSNHCFQLPLLLCSKWTTQEVVTVCSHLYLANEDTEAQRSETTDLLTQILSLFIKPRLLPYIPRQSSKAPRTVLTTEGPMLSHYWFKEKWGFTICF